MTTKVNEDFHNPNVALVDTDVQWSLTALVASVQIGSTTLKHSNHFRLVAKCRVMHSTVTILVLHETHHKNYWQVSMQSRINWLHIPHVTYLTTSYTYITYTVVHCTALEY